MLDRVGEDDEVNWRAWHAEYDQAGSRLERRLAVVNELLRVALSSGRPGPLRLLSACAGEGRDVLGVLPEHPRGGEVTALLVEADPNIAAGTAELARRLGLEIAVQVGDAGVAGSYATVVPVDVALFCGVFGNITPDDVAMTVSKMATLLAPGARVIWTRGRDQADDPTGAIRTWFGEAGFVEEAFVAPEDDVFRSGRSSFSVGMHRLVAPPAHYEPDLRLFDFIGYRRVRRS